MQYDIFNGDADGICALQQLRLAEPVDSELVTGVKRDISLLSKVNAQQGDNLTVLDISLDKNRGALLKNLDNGANITYFDHHYAGNIPQHPQLQAVIDTQPDTCTSLLVNNALNGKYLAWAVTAAFGDNLFTSAVTAAKPLNLTEQQLQQLKLLGTYINYNGYGSELDDLFYHPAELFKKIKPFNNPFDFINMDEAYKILQDGYQADMSAAKSVVPELNNKLGEVYILPDSKSSRRVSGVFGNNLAQQNPDKAHAVITSKGTNLYQVSVRAPLNNKTGADELCRQFATGGGRKAAAGINELPEAELPAFIEKFQQQFAS